MTLSISEFQVLTDGGDRLWLFNNKMILDSEALSFTFCWSLTTVLHGEVCDHYSFSTEGEREVLQYEVACPGSQYREWRIQE